LFKLKKLRILFIGWQKGKAGGVPIYTESLCKQLWNKGHEVIYLYAGEYDLKRNPYIRTINSPNGIKYVAILNSPNEYLNISRPLQEIKEPSVEKLVIDFIRKLKPDIIHVQNMMGLSSSIIEISADLGYPIIVSHHNYWFICPRIELLRLDKRLCQGPEFGINCAWCCNSKKYRNMIQFGKLTKRIKGSLRPIVRSVYFLSQFEMLYHSIRKGKLRSAIKRNISFDIYGLYDSFDYYSHRESINPNYILKYNIRAEYHRYLLKDKVYINLAVSSAVKDRLIKFGVPQKKILIQHIGTRAAEFIKILPKPQINQQVNFGFMGPLRYEKGVHLLIKAFSKLKPDSCSLKIFGSVSDIKYLKYLKYLTLRSKNINFYGPYNYESLSEILQGIHYLVVPPIWYDNAPQVVMEALASKTPVIGANIGGIPDFVQDGKNGLLFKPNDEEDLLRCMQLVINNRELFMKFREKIKPLKTMKEHVVELEELYYRIKHKNEII